MKVENIEYFVSGLKLKAESMMSLMFSLSIKNKSWQNEIFGLKTISLILVNNGNVNQKK